MVSEEFDVGDVFVDDCVVFDVVDEAGAAVGVIEECLIAEAFDEYGVFVVVVVVAEDWIVFDVVVDDIYGVVVDVVNVDGTVFDVVNVDGDVVEDKYSELVVCKDFVVVNVVETGVVLYDAVEECAEVDVVNKVGLVVVDKDFLEVGVVNEDGVVIDGDVIGAVDEK